MSTTKNGAHREPMSESETLRVDLEQTRQHLADTVQELSRRLNVPHRMKETAGHAGQTMKQTAGHAGQAVKETAGHAGQAVKQTAEQAVKQVPGAVKQVPGAVKQVPGAVKELPAVGKRHPRAVAAVGGAFALGVAAAAWMARRHK
ncbi:hypothetical protein GCM10009630_68800 [Kribbella jejuensis]|uniref:Uncharacterized protein DUF3618 n=1 Tax=Kribbella jejuensis TaxID=236068 RepID=A0A542EQT4_9ACTN|nr:DUF3618 domain-containing protein [Kribbella jejuensis]TQJ17689.1 uncharacterized protein DUF3618 [Kribbella jejuensis]